MWDGSLPFVHGSPAAIPNVFTVQAHAIEFRAADHAGNVQTLGGITRLSVDILEYYANHGQEFLAPNTLNEQEGEAAHLQFNERIAA